MSTKVESVAEAVANVKASLKLSSSSTHSQRSAASSNYANAGSYLKTRRTAAKKNRRSEIMGFLDGASGHGGSLHGEEESDYLNDLLPSISGHSRDRALGGKPPFVKLSIKSKNRLPKSVNSKKISPEKKKKKSKRKDNDNTSKQNSGGMEEVLRNLPSSAATSTSSHDTLSTSQSATSLDYNSTQSMSLGTLSFAEEDMSASLSFGYDESGHDQSASSLASIPEQRLDLANKTKSTGNETEDFRNQAKEEVIEEIRMARAEANRLKIRKAKEEEARLREQLKEETAKRKEETEKQRQEGLRVRQREAEERQKVVDEERAVEEAERKDAEAIQVAKIAKQCDDRQRLEELRKQEEEYERSPQRQEFQSKAEQIRQKAIEKAAAEEAQRKEKEEEEARRSQQAAEEATRIEAEEKVAAEEAARIEAEASDEDSYIEEVIVSEDEDEESYIEEEILVDYESDTSSVEEIEYFSEDEHSEYEEEVIQDALQVWDQGDEDSLFEEEIVVADDEASYTEEEVVLSDEESFVEEEILGPSDFVKDKLSTWDVDYLEETSFTDEETVEDQSDEEMMEEVVVSDSETTEQDIYEEMGVWKEEILQEYYPAVDDDYDDDEILVSDVELEEITVADEQMERFHSTLGSIEEEDDSEYSGDAEDSGIMYDADGTQLDIVDEDEEDDVEKLLAAEVDEEEVWMEDENGDIEIQETNPTSIINEIVDPETGEVLFEVEEEEYVPQFKVPVVPALVAHQMRQEEKEIEEEEEPPEVAPRTPRSVLMAILSAAAADFKLRKVPKEHKKKFVSIADAAASLGRLFKLGETVIESVSVAPRVQKVDDWKPTGKPIALLRSSNLRLVNEAAAMGRLVRLKEKVFVNYKEKSHVREQRTAIEDMVDERGYKVFRTNVLVHYHVSDVKKESMGRDWNTNILEEVTEAEETTIENVKLPTPRVPRFRPTTTSLSPAEVNEAIARGVAEGAWDRKYRLERPQIKLRIQSSCRCKYCANPNPYQTHAYKRMANEQSRQG